MSKRTESFLAALEKYDSAVRAMFDATSRVQQLQREAEAAGGAYKIAEINLQAAKQRLDAAILKSDSESWPTEHESDCPILDGADCRCPIGNL